MKKYITKTEEVQELSELVCDVCKKTFSNDNYIEWDEFTHISFQGGFGSVFGDSNLVTLDICQHCLKEKLGQYINIDSF